MIAAWMLYTIIVSLVLFAGAIAFEFVARTLGIPTRWVWAGAIVAVLTLSFTALTRRAPDRAAVAVEVRDTMVRMPSRRPAPAVAVQREVRAERIGIGSSTGILTRIDQRMERAVESVRRIDISPLDRWNTALASLWLLSAAVGLLYIIFGLQRAQAMARMFAPHETDGHQVLVSPDVGPALLGVLQPRIVVPSWVLDLASKDRRVILEHERQHAVAGDPLLLVVCSIAVALQAWNPVLWLLLARVRLAIETDCDQRVLDAGARDVRHYGGLLVTVQERVSPAFASVGFAERPSNLESRIRRMTESTPRLMSLTGAFAICAALFLFATAWATPSPMRSRWPRSAPKWNADTAARMPRRAPAAYPRATVAARAPQAAPAAVAPASAPALPVRARAAEVCGFNVALDKLCTAKADVLIHAADSLHVAIALRERDAMGQPVEHVFYVTFVAPPSALLARLIPSAHVEYQSGALYIASPRPSEPALVFGGANDELVKRHPRAQLFDNIVGLAHYSADGLPFDMVPRLRRSARCDAERPTCFEAGGMRVQFP